MFSRLTLGLIVLASFAFAAPAQAAPGALNVLVTGNQGGTVSTLASMISSDPDVVSADAFDTSGGTPLAGDLTPYDVVVSLGDSDYNDPQAWGDRLADYVDGGGKVLQAAYDNWDSVGAAPTGRFASDGYPPLLNGNNDNASVTLGTILVPGSPLLQGIGTFPSGDNTTTALAPGATLLAEWSDGRNAIAVKNRVVATSASPGDSSSMPDVARLAVNTGNYAATPPAPQVQKVTVTKSGTGVGTVTSAPAGISCGTTCASAFAWGKLVLTATPNAESQFKGWTGACSGVALCEPTVAGSDLSIGAVFDLAAFSKKTLVTLAAVSTKASSSGSFKVRVKNTNLFTVTGSLSVGTAGKVHVARLVPVSLKAKKFSLKGGSSTTLTFSLPKLGTKTLNRKDRLKLMLTAKVKSPSGASRTVNQRVKLKP
jgi:hypothetical protein